MPAEQHFLSQGRDKNRLGVQFVESSAEPLQIRLTCQDGDVDVATELGGAVQDARLTAHEQSAHAMFPESRKDFANRVRDQASLPEQGTWPIVSATRESAAPALAATRPASPDHKAVHSERTGAAYSCAIRLMVGGEW